MQEQSAIEGVVVVDKPADWTSHDVVNKIRRIAGTKRVGHLGTLDPMATGVLPLVVGRATRLAQFYTRAEKVYDAIVCFGFATATYDSQGERTGEIHPCQFTRERLDEELNRFRGTFQQTPPPVSAKKVGGVPAYKLARKNVDVQLQPVEVTVHDLIVHEVHLESAGQPHARIEVHCTAGTYLRAIAHDLGQALGCGAHLSRLRRLRSGDFSIDQARTLEQLAELSHQGRLREAVIPPALLLPQFPSEIVDSITASQIRQGRDFRVSPFRPAKGAPLVKAVTAEGDLIAIGEARLPHLYHPMLVL
ncbi:MAG: tRNA pseudouridine(55) synthase TruB [Bryobacteraceae bacterium]